LSPAVRQFDISVFYQQDKSISN